MCQEVSASRLVTTNKNGEILFKKFSSETHSAGQGLGLQRTVSDGGRSSSLHR